MNDENGRFVVTDVYNDINNKCPNCGGWVEEICHTTDGEIFECEDCGTEIIQDREMV